MNPAIALAIILAPSRDCNLLAGNSFFIALSIDRFNGPGSPCNVCYDAKTQASA